ncbi:hypothetical protein ACFX2I_024019 [Malus domestica]
MYDLVFKSPGQLLERMQTYVRMFQTNDTEKEHGIKTDHCHKDKQDSSSYLQLHEQEHSSKTELLPKTDTSDTKQEILSCQKLKNGTKLNEQLKSQRCIRAKDKALFLSQQIQHYLFTTTIPKKPSFLITTTDLDLSQNENPSTENRTHNSHTITQFAAQTR